MRFGKKKNSFFTVSVMRSGMNVERSIGGDREKVPLPTADVTIETSETLLQPTTCG
jgi:hypothetical protein